MRISASSGLILSAVVGGSDAFAPSTKLGATRRPRTARSFSLMDHSNLPDLPNQLQSLHDAFASSNYFLADLDADALTSGVTAAIQGADAAATAGGAVANVADVADAAAKTTNNGWFGFLTGPTMGFLQLIHTGLVAVGLSKDAWGVSIIVLTLTIKLLTFPLTKSQMESTNKMQVCCARSS
jgi:hypothetical protein